MAAKKVKRLSPEELADAVEVTYRHLLRPEQEGLKPQLWAFYEGGGWISVRGQSLPAHPDMRHQYPNGWSMLDRIRTTEARRRLQEAAR